MTEYEMIVEEITDLRIEENIALRVFQCAATVSSALVAASRLDYVIEKLRKAHNALGKALSPAVKQL